MSNISCISHKLHKSGYNFYLFYCCSPGIDGVFIVGLFFGHVGIGGGWHIATPTVNTRNSIECTLN